jgi:hypothetical protein
MTTSPVWMPSRTARRPPVRLLQTRIQCPHHLDQAEPAAHGPLHGVFVRLGIAEIHQQAIAEVLGRVFYN